MPYYVYYVALDKTETELKKECDSYKEAKAEVMALRKANPDKDLNTFRLMFAKDAQQARILLTTKRAPTPVKEWEV
jgi:hypothetical protein